MQIKKILVADPDPAPLPAISQALTPLALDLELETAITGQAVLDHVEHHDYCLILLALMLPGMEDLKLLDRLVNHRPDIPVIITSSQGTIEIAVKAMKLGAVNYIAKPIAPEELRKNVALILDPVKAAKSRQSDYAAHLALLRQCLDNGHPEAAMEHACQAIRLDPGRPEAFNALGVIYDVNSHRSEALKNYRVAVDLDSTYEPAWYNLTRQPLSIKLQRYPPPQLEQ